MIHMSKKWFLAGLVALLMLLCAVALADTATVTADSLYLREGPNSTSAVVKTLRNGEVLTITGKSGSWYQVTIGKYSGYVYKDYVSVTKSGEETLKKGDSGSAVKAVQQRLKELGYYSSSIDGSYGAKTVEAVKAFQKKNSLSQTGIVDAATQKKLNASNAVKASTTTTTTTTATSLKKGDKGAEVKKLQERLKELGYYSSAIDSSYGTKTVEAVKAFQKKNGLTADGVAGTATLKKLNSTSAVKNTTTTTTTTNTNTTLKSGAKGEAVKELQRRLKELGYYNNAIDGDYGAKTVVAVKAFQKKNGLTADGVAGSTTLKKLNSTSAVKAGTTTTTTTTTTTSGLKSGATGAEVKKLQERLKELGYYTAAIDSSYGAKTIAAVKAFQQKNGLTADGVAGTATMNKLNSSNAVAANGKTTVELKTNQTLKSGDSGAQVKALQARLKELGYYTTTLDSSYGYRTVEAVSAFQRANKLTVNGTANSTTLRKLVSSSAVSASKANSTTGNTTTTTTKYKTERLDWFNGGRAKFANRPTIEIKDVKTGLVFKGKVLYGENHLDVEPLTKADTATLLKINGGVEFKWNRRPMLVKHNGHVYAASIYSVPHGEQTILDNNYEGQFCLHFYGSKTHGTDEVKQDHQDAIAQAMKATW